MTVSDVKPYVGDVKPHVGDVKPRVGDVRPNERATGDCIYSIVFSRKAASESSLDEDVVGEPFLLLPSFITPVLLSFVTAPLLGMTIFLRFHLGDLRPPSSMSSQPERSCVPSRASESDLYDFSNSTNKSHGSDSVREV